MFCFHWKLFIPPDNDLNCDHQDERKRKKEKAPEKDIRHFHVSPLRFPKAFLFSTGHSSVCIVFVFVCLFVLKNPLIHFSSCFAQKANTAVNPFCPESLPAFPEASLLIQWPPPSLPLRLASLSEPTATTALPQPHAACLAAARRSHSLEVTMPLLQVPITWKSTAPRGEIPLLRLPPCRELVLLPAGKPAGRHHDNGLAQSPGDARPDSPPSLTQVCLGSSCFCWASFCLSVWGSSFADWLQGVGLRIPGVQGSQ